MFLLSEVEGAVNTLCLPCMKYELIFSLVKIIHFAKKNPTMYDLIANWDTVTQGISFV